MDAFEERLAEVIKQVAIVSDHPPTQNEIDIAVASIMEAIKAAIETAGVSEVIDTWFVRTAMGKQGTRGNRELPDTADSIDRVERMVRDVGALLPPGITHLGDSDRMLAALEANGKRVEYPADPRIEIFVSVYATERMGNASPDAASARALIACERFCPTSVKVD